MEWIFRLLIQWVPNSRDWGETTLPKGKSVRLTIDLDLQKIAEDSIDRMVQKVAKQRILPDKVRAKTLERRTGRALVEQMKRR